MLILADHTTWEPTSLTVSADAGATREAITPDGALGVQDVTIAKFEGLWFAHVNIRLGTFQIPAAYPGITDLLIYTSEELNPKFRRLPPYDYQQGLMMGRLGANQEVLTYQVFSGEGGTKGVLWFNRMNNTVFPNGEDITIYGAFGFPLS
jgi:hypothetical protein